MMFYVTRNCGQKNKHYRLIGLIQNGLNGAGNRACSERVKTAVLQHRQPSGAIRCVLIARSL